jgi:sigma-B regulation protein RsbU (phosphoserine phosphatase)
LRGAWAYAVLAIVFVIAVAVQGMFTWDLIQDLRLNYAASPLELGSPWPTVTRVGSEAEAAGLQLGDRVVSIGGRSPAGLKDLAAAVRGARPGQSILISAEREGKVADYRVVLSASRQTVPAIDWVVAGVVWFLIPVLCIGVGFWVSAARPLDVRAWLVLAVLLGLNQLVRPSQVDPRGWPDGIRTLAILYRQAATQSWPIWLILFGLHFPGRSWLERNHAWAKWVLVGPLALLGGWITIFAAGLAENYQAATDLIPAPPVSDMQQAVVWGAGIVLFFVALSSQYGDPWLAADDRRRLRLLYWGCSVGLFPLTSLLVYNMAFLGRDPEKNAWMAAAVLSLSLFPATMAYVIVVERAIDVRVVIRQGMQYALARGGIRTLQVLITAGVILTVLAVEPGVNRPQWLIAIASGVAAVFLIRHVVERVGRWVDRRFFREEYNAERILGELSEDVRTMVETGPLLETVAGRISQALHVQRLAVLVEEDGCFRTALATGYLRRPEARLSGQAVTISQLRQAGDPIRLYERGRFGRTWLREVSEEERRALRELEAELLLPVTSKHGLLGVLCLGPKKSEEPYSPSDVRLLRTVAAQTGLALENSRLAAAVAAGAAQRERLNREIEIAREVQQRLFPQVMPRVDGLEYAGRCRPVEGVGGDYYDFLEVPGGRLGLVIADVSGKGLSAALLMASLQASARGQSRSGGGNLASLVANVNRQLYEATASNRYATFVYAEFASQTRSLSYVNAGHNPPLLVRDGQARRLETGGLVLGLLPDLEYEQGEVSLEPGDMLIFYTDGISEAQNAAEEDWGEARLIEAVLASMQAPPREIIDRVMEAADRFTAGAPQHDDMTLVIARVLG